MFGKLFRKKIPVHKFYYYERAFSFLAPARFTPSGQEGVFQIADDADNVITVSAWNHADSDFADFYATRKSAVQDFLQPVQDDVRHQSAHATAVEMRYEGVWPGETAPTYYVVWAIELKPLFISLTYVGTRQHYESHHDEYVRLFESLQIG